MPSLYEKFGGKQEEMHLQVSMMHLIMYTVRTSRLPALKKERKKWKEIGWHTPSREFYSFSPSSHLLRRQNPLSVPMSPSGKVIWVLIRRSKRSHSPPALGEFQNQNVHVRIPFPVRVQFLNKTQGKGIPLGKSGYASWTITSGSMPSFTRCWGTQGSRIIGLSGRTTQRRFLEPALCLCSIRDTVRPTPSGMSILKGTVHEHRWLLRSAYATGWPALLLR